MGGLHKNTIVHSDYVQLSMYKTLNRGFKVWIETVKANVNACSKTVLDITNEHEFVITISCTKKAYLTITTTGKKQC